jgi:uncharacterized protein with ParB-like and HNH nuclease domain
LGTNLYFDNTSSIMPLDNSINNRTFEELFSNRINFEIPFFQRAYAWEREQWKQLFDDINEQIIGDVSDQIREELSTQKVSKEILDKYLYEHEHYFGAIVVLEKNNSDPALKCFSVIDGQQRITTVYLLLVVIIELLKGKSDISVNAQAYINHLEGLIINNIDPKGDDYKKLKVYSNKGDRYPTYLKIFKDNPESSSLSVDMQLYVKGQNQVDAFYDYASKKLRDYSIADLVIFAQAILKSLKIVWIPLDEKKDNPQSIFEGLNDKGMPLSAIELLCSYVFKPLIDDSTKKHEHIHNDYWLKTIRKVGSESSFELYLRNLLSIGQRKMIGKGRKLYSHFKSTHKKLDKPTASAFLEDVCKNAILFNYIVKPTEPANKHPHPEISSLLIRIEQTQMYTSIPFVLAVLKENKSGRVSDADTISLFKTLLVLLVRRKVCELKTTKYDTFFPNLLNNVANEPDKERAFKELIKKEDLWVSNQEFEDAFVNKPIYKQTELVFARLILQEIDKKMQPHNQYPDYTSINTIEHVLPQTLDAEWKSYLGTDVNDPNLDRIKNTIGNLCLISRTANSHVGQNPFEKKQNSYSEISALTREIKKCNHQWNIQSIKSRSNDLAKVALEVWKWD